MFLTWIFPFHLLKCVYQHINYEYCVYQRIKMSGREYFPLLTKHEIHLQLMVLNEMMA